MIIINDIQIISSRREGDATLYSELHSNFLTIIIMLI